MYILLFIYFKSLKSYILKEDNFKLDDKFANSSLQFYDLIVKTIVNLNLQLSKIYMNSQNDPNKTLQETSQIIK